MLLASLKNIRYLVSDRLSPFVKNFEKGDYYGVLQIKNITELTDDQLKNKYYQLLKQYHSDYSQHESKQIISENQQITKYVNMAYQKICSNRYHDYLYSSKTQTKESSNIHRPSKYYEQHTQQNEFNEEFIKQYFSPRKAMKNLAWITLSIIFIGYCIKKYFDFREQKRIQRFKDILPTQISKQQFQKIQDKTQEKIAQKKQKIIEKFVQQHPNMLSYPTKQDPPVITQLIKYSIAQDIHLYEVDPCLFEDNINKKPLDQNFKRHFISKIRLNTTLTLSLQAERCLQNIYVKVKDVISEIQQKGKYQPPIVFFRFYGFIMFQIRQKPLSLQNYRNTEYISLFDLYFDYYSPIFFKRYQFNQYLVERWDMKKFGSVHLNHREIPEQYIKKDTKYVFMRNEPNKDNYIKLWKGFYEQYKQSLSTYYKKPT